MPSASIIKKIPCSKKNLIEMVLDIEKYPEFVPWCLGGKIHTKIDKGNIVEITADLTIGKSFFRETYKSFVIYDKSNDLIQVTNIGGPLKHLKNKWFFKQIDHSSELDFRIEDSAIASFLSRFFLKNILLFFIIIFLLELFFLKKSFI